MKCAASPGLESAHRGLDVYEVDVAKIFFSRKLLPHGLAQLRPAARIALFGDHLGRSRDRGIEAGKERAQRGERLPHGIAAETRLCVRRIDRIRQRVRVAVGA